LGSLVNWGTLLPALCARTRQRFAEASGCSRSFHRLDPYSSGTSGARSNLRTAPIGGSGTGLTFQSFARTSED